jgi:3-methyladenine DNA glycosylase AlkD
MDDILISIRRKLADDSDEKLRESGKRFFKEDVKSYGFKSADVAKISKEYFKLIKDKSKAEIFELCEELWKSGFMEESFIACSWSYNIHKDFKPEDINVFERWIGKYVTNWAACDTLCNHTVGEFIEMYPEYISFLKKWAKSENRWMKRASSVTLIIPAKKGKFLNDVFEIADILLQDDDDIVQKGYGWMLKVAANKHLNEVFDYVVKNKRIMPRTSLRYAVEKMPEDMKRKAMEK